YTTHVFCCCSFVLSFLSFHCYPHHQDLHSFPTRRSSDLAQSSQHLCLCSSQYTLSAFRKPGHARPARKLRAAKRHHQPDPGAAPVQQQNDVGMGAVLCRTRRSGGGRRSQSTNRNGLSPRLRPPSRSTGTANEQHIPEAAKGADC